MSPTQLYVDKFLNETQAQAHLYVVFRLIDLVQSMCVCMCVCMLVGVRTSFIAAQSLMD